MKQQGQTLPTGHADLVYEMKVTLEGIKPPIWRRILVPHDISLYRLHQVLQVAMGWTESHLHEFTVGGISYGDPEVDTDEHVKHEKRFKLSQVVPGENVIFSYTYDFGDCWEHEVIVEKILPKEDGAIYPVCLDGKRACPPEDCGGAPGYEGLLAILSDPSHPEHDRMFEWLPGDFDSEKFDIDEANRRLNGIDKRSTKKAGDNRIS